MSNSAYAKTVIINRAVPGSGKTTLTHCMTEAFQKAGLSVGVHSTDDYFMNDGKYIFDIAKLMPFHQLNQQAFEKDLAKGIDVAICDNTNLMPWQTKPYTDMARKYGYKVFFLNIAPHELWKHVQSQQVTPERPDAHQVPEASIVEDITEYNLYNALFDRQTPPIPGIHLDFTWNDELQDIIPTGKTADYFDFDCIIQVCSDTFTEMKKTLGAKMLALMAD